MRINVQRVISSVCLFLATSSFDGASQMVAEFKFCKRLDKNTTSIPRLEATRMKISSGLFPTHISKSGPLASCFMPACLWVQGFFLWILYGRWPHSLFKCFHLLSSWVVKLQSVVNRPFYSVCHLCCMVSGRLVPEFEPVNVMNSCSRWQTSLKNSIVLTIGAEWRRLSVGSIRAHFLSFLEFSGKSVK